MLDPLARHDFMATVMTAVADDGVSVVLSSHVLAELERVADYLVLVSRGRVQVAGEVDDLLATPSRAHRPGFTRPSGIAERGTSSMPAVAHPGPPARPRRHTLAIRCHRGGRRTRSASKSSPLPTSASPAPRRCPGPARAAGHRTDGGDAMTTLELAVPARRRGANLGRCRGGGWPGSPGASTASRWPAWSALAAIVACTCGVVGLQLHHAYAAATRLPPGGLGCLHRADRAASTSVGPASTNRLVLQVVPALIGAFVGAPVLAREMETGTFRYAWTQGFGRWRWTLAKLAPLAVAVARRGRRLQRAVLLVLPAVFGRGNQARSLSDVDSACSQPVRPARSRVRRLDAGRLRDRRTGRHAHPPGRPRDCRHPGRRTPGSPSRPGLSCAEHYWRRVVTTNTERAQFRRGSSARTGRQGGQAVSQSVINQVLQRRTSAGRPGKGRGRTSHALRRPCSTSPSTATRMVTTYQPASRFWPFQWIEGGWLLRAVGAAHRRHRLAGPPPAPPERHAPSPSGSTTARPRRRTIFAITGRSGLPRDSWTHRSPGTRWALSPPGPRRAASPSSEMRGAISVRSRRPGQSLRRFALHPRGWPVVFFLAAILHGCSRPLTRSECLARPPLPA